MPDFSLSRVAFAKNRGFWALFLAALPS